MNISIDINIRASEDIMKPMQAKEINDILRKMEGWEPYSKGTGKLRFGKNYGLQRAFVRVVSS